jgi:serine/threonine protein kinase
MALTCPNCHRTLPASDEPPRFCAFCGHRLADPTPTGPQSAPTAPYVGPESEAAPTEVGGYRILRHLGSGGMGQVYEAEPLGGGPHVALKLLSGRLTANPVSVERFRQEGRLAAQIAHPRCVFVLRADADRGRPYIVMELMPGDTLKDLVDRRKSIPAPEAIRLILDVIDGLQEAHRLGVIHRDVKPSNCFVLPDGRVKVGDFGLSKSLGSAAQLTTSGAFLGTVLYASPEQIKGEPVDFASDVYSVCATLYHLLAGRAPFHHENPTAVLAKIISEDPPDVRSVNSTVPADLAYVVHRGLERDRARRYATLTELRAALVALVPEQLTFGGLGVRVGAYLLDELIVRALFVVPIQALLQASGSRDWVIGSVALVLFPVYFILLEGLFGRSWGKGLLGLRVCRQGTTLPPGFRRALIRTLVFYVLITVTLTQAGQVFTTLAGGEADADIFLHLVPFLIGLLILVVPMRKANDFRGLHETLSGTCVLRLPLVPRPLTLVGRHGDRLLAVPPRPPEFPEVVGPYTVGHAIRAGDQWVAVGDDQVLGRRVLLRLYPSRDGPAVRSSGGRPGRLWPLGRGAASIADTPHLWEAYVAPAGAPLADVVDRRHPVRWPEAHPILEQLAAELAAAQKDGSLPGQLSLDQVWVQPHGRPQLLDFPVGPTSGLTDVTGVLRQSAATLLEGAPRLPADRGPIRAPLPRHAARLLDRLAGGPLAITSPAEFGDELAGIRHLPGRVTRGSRAIQLAVQAGTVGFGLLVMFLAVGMYSVGLALESEHFLARAVQLRAAEAVVEFSATPEGRARLGAEPAFRETVERDPAFVERLAGRIPNDRAELRAAMPGLNRVERYFRRLLENARVGSETDQIVAAAIELDQQPATLAPISRMWWEGCVEILIWPVLWAVSAFVLRGGLSYLLTGIRIVRPTGASASRRRCAARALLVWLPVALILSAAVVIRAESPLSEAYLPLLVIAAILLPVYFALALIDPERGPHDRLLGTWLVPR